MPTNTARIAKNTLALYFKQILLTTVSLYTVRVVLNTLGAEDYGIYNVIVGLVTMFSFIRDSMVLSIQRYFSYELGRGDFERLNQIFNQNFTVNIIIAFLVLLLAETIGLWFVSNKVVIPIERKDAALWAYHFSILSFLLSILVIPYMAMIIAHEDMNIHAYGSVIEAILKLGVVFILNFIAWDRLKLYGTLMCIVTFIHTIIYSVICIMKYHECKIKFYWDNKLFKDMISYTGWNIFPVAGDILQRQGITILLNQFFNPAVVVARGISLSINNTVVTFSQNFNMALRPQIIKTHAANQKKKTLTLVFSGTKMTYFLMYVFALPLFIELPYILLIWLKNPPEYLAIFTRLTLINILITSLSYPLLSLVQATGKTKIYQGIAGVIGLLNFPASWIVVSIGFEAYSVMIISILITCVVFVIQLIILKTHFNFPLLNFLKEVIFLLILVTVLSACMPFFLHSFFEQSFKRLCIVIAASVLSIFGFVYLLGLKPMERQKAKQFLKKYLMNKLN
jgi:O-antigen/teichoic acid export membrane protein